MHVHTGCASFSTVSRWKVFFLFNLYSQLSHEKYKLEVSELVSGDMLVCPVSPVALRLTDTVPYCQLWLHPRLEEARTKVRQTHRDRKKGWGQRDRTRSGVTEKSRDDLFLQHIQDLPQNTIYFISPQSITLSSSFLSECLFCVFYWLLHQHTNAVGQRISHKTISDCRDGNNSDKERGILQQFEMEYSLFKFTLYIFFHPSLHSNLHFNVEWIKGWTAMVICFNIKHIWSNCLVYIISSYRATVTSK